MRLHSLSLCFAFAGLLGACGGGGDECGNNEIEGDEECDDGNMDLGDGCDSLCVVERAPTAYRVESLFLRDPNMFAFDGTVNITGAVNSAISDNLTMDGDDPADGILDLSMVFVLRPPRPTAASGLADAVIGAECTDPVETTTCSAGAGSTVLPTTATNSDDVCLTPLADTTSNYDPPVGTPPGRCFVSDREDAVTIDLGGVLLAMQDVRIAATYAAGDPPAMLTNGLFVGFITEATADATLLPDDLLFVGGMPLSNELLTEDMDMGPNGEMGWYFYLNFTAVPVPYTE